MLVCALTLGLVSVSMANESGNVVVVLGPYGDGYNQLGGTSITSSANPVNITTGIRAIPSSHTWTIVADSTVIPGTTVTLIVNAHGNSYITYLITFYGAGEWAFPEEISNGTAFKVSADYPEKKKPTPGNGNNGSKQTPKPSPTPGNGDNGPTPSPTPGNGNKGNGPTPTPNSPTPTPNSPTPTPTPNSPTPTPGNGDNGNGPSPSPTPGNGDNGPTPSPTPGNGDNGPEPTPTPNGPEPTPEPTPDVGGPGTSGPGGPRFTRPGTDAPADSAGTAATEPEEFEEFEEATPLAAIEDEYIPAADVEDEEIVPITAEVLPPEDGGPAVDAAAGHEALRGMPQTGVSDMLAYWLVGLCTSLLLSAILFELMRKKRKESKVLS